MKLSATDLGDGSPAVLLHGQPGEARDWDPVAIRLRERLRVSHPCLVGSGELRGFRELQPQI